MGCNRLGNIQALRAIAVLLVVVRHVQVYMVRSAGAPPVLGQFLVGDMGVDLFFVISGFIMVVVHPPPFTRAAQSGSFLARRVIRIYPLYWIYSVPALAIYWWKPGWLHRFDAGMQVHLLRSFLLWPQEGWPLLGQAWSLVYEMYFYVVFAGLLRLRGKWFCYGLLAWEGLVLAGNFVLPSVPALDRPETHTAFALITLEFIAGALAALAFRRIATAPTPAPGWLFVGLGTAWTVAMTLPLGVHLTASNRVLAYGLPSVAVLWGAVLLERAGRRAPRWLVSIGDWSYSIYLSHIFVIAALARIVSPDLTHHPVARGFCSILCTGAVLLVGAASYYALERPLLRLARRALLGRFTSHIFHPIATPAFASCLEPPTAHPHADSGHLAVSQRNGPVD